MSEDSTTIKEDYGTIEADLNIRSLHELARNGQLEGLKTILDSGTVNVNSLCRTEGLDPLTPLSCAVKNGSIACIDLLLEYGGELNPSRHLDKQARKHPLVCALECRNQEVIKHIVAKGADIKMAFAVLSNINDSDLYKTLHLKVDLELSEISVLELQETPPNFEALQELVEPEVLCSCDSPIDMALDLEEACSVAARISTEHSVTYQLLAKQCQSFAKDFLACCQVPSDAELLLSMKNADNTFGRALMYNEKEFLTQPWIQAVCEKQWHGELDGQYNCFSCLKSIVKVLLAPILVPFWLAYGLMAGNLNNLNKLIQLIGSPCLCFFSFVISHLLFFVLLMFICTVNATKKHSIFEILGFIWLLGKIISDLLKYYKVIRLTSFKVSILRATFDWFYMLFFGTLVGVRIYTSHFATKDINLLLFVADVLYAVGTILHILQLVYVLQVTKFLGPILISVRYFLWDLCKFLTILFIMNLTFSIAITKVFSAYNVYSEKVSLSSDISDRFSHFIAISTTLFWASFCLVDLNDFKEYKTHIMAGLLIAVYVILSSGLLVMMLFAMVNYQYSKAKKRFDTEWKFLSVKLTHEFSLLHPSILPLNLVSLPVSIAAQAVVRLCGHSTRFPLFGGKDQVVEPHLVYYIQSKVILKPDCEEERQSLIASLTTTYLTRKSWPGLPISKVQRRREAAQDDDDEGDAHSMTSSPNGVVDPSVAMERMSCNIEKQEHSISELRRANQDLSFKMDLLLKRVRSPNSTDC